MDDIHDNDFVALRVIPNPAPPDQPVIKIKYPVRSEMLRVAVHSERLY